MNSSTDNQHPETPQKNVGLTDLLAANCVNEKPSDSNAMPWFYENALKLYLTWMKRSRDLIALADRVPNSEALMDNLSFTMKAVTIHEMANELAIAIPFREATEGLRPSVPLSQSLPFLVEYLKEREA